MVQAFYLGKWNRADPFGLDWEICEKRGCQTTQDKTASGRTCFLELSGAEQGPAAGTT